MEARLELDRVPSAEGRQKADAVFVRMRALETLADPMKVQSVWIVPSVVVVDVLAFANVARVFPQYGLYVAFGAMTVLALVVAGTAYAQIRQLRKRIDALQDLVRDLDERR